MFSGLLQLKAGQTKVRSEMLDIIHLEIQEYFERVMVDNSHYHDALQWLAQLLVSNNYFCIDDISGEAVQWLVAEPYNLSSGNAKLVVVILKAEIDRIKREAEGV